MLVGLVSLALALGHDACVGDSAAAAATGPDPRAVPHLQALAPLPPLIAPAAAEHADCAAALAAALRTGADSHPPHDGIGPGPLVGLDPARATPRPRRWLAPGTAPPRRRALLQVYRI